MWFGALIILMMIVSVIILAVLSSEAENKK